MMLRDVMASPAVTCRGTASLSEAARLMLDENIGCVPVVDSRGHLTGMLTDRDVCLAVARHFDPATTPVGDVMTREVVSCRDGADLTSALVAIKQHRVRRIPVVNERGTVRGLFSIDDAIRDSGVAAGRLPAESVMDVLRHLCTSRRDLSSTS